MPETEDLYEILHLHPSAHPDVIQAAYRRLALLYHPDKNPSPEATEMMAAVNRAYAVLSDPEKRTEYDRSRASQAGNVGASSPSADTTSQTSRPQSNAPQNPTGYFTLGSTKSEVADIHGPPHDVSIDRAIREEVWHYGSDDTIEFDLDTGKVQGWSNIRGNLRIRLVPGHYVTSLDFFTEGAPRDEVARLHGTPPVIIARQESDLEIWLYHNGNNVGFTFSTGRVIGWENNDGTLKAHHTSNNRSTTSNEDEFLVRYASKEEVFRIQGPPTSIENTNIFEIWRYGRSYILFSLSDGTVVRWSNADDNLRVPPSDASTSQTSQSRTRTQPNDTTNQGSRTRGSSAGHRARTSSSNNWRSFRDNSPGIYTVDPIDPDYGLIVQFRNRELELYVVWGTEVSYSETTTVNYQIDNGPTWRQLWHVSTDRKATFMPGQDVAETIRALFNADEFTARVYPFGGSPITASFEVTGFLEAVSPVLEAWRRAGSPAPRIRGAEGGGCFLLPVSMLSAVGVAASAIWFLL